MLLLKPFKITPLQGPVKLKFESGNLQLCKQKPAASQFAGYFQKTYVVFEQLHCYEVTLVKKYNKPLLQTTETKNNEKLAQRQQEKKLE